MKIPRALTIAGSDSGGGAGIQADLKTFAALGVHGMSAITSITAQNTVEVTMIHDVPVELIREQIRVVVRDIGVDAIKTGMLHTSEIIEAVASEVSEIGAPLVVDPVMIAKSGAPLIRKEAMKTLIEDLIPRAFVVTPNAREAEALSGIEIRDLESQKEAAREISDLGVKAVVVKGGHIPGPKVVDVLYYDGEFRLYESERIESGNTHGTGCTFASAIAAELAKGHNIFEAVGVAKRFVSYAIRYGLSIGRGHGPVDPVGKIIRHAEKFEVLEVMRRALERVEESGLIGKAIPECQSNLAMACSYARDLDDVAAVPGRIVRFWDRAKPSSPPWFGASKHVGKAVLTTMKFDHRIRSAMNIKFDERLIKAAEELGWRISFYDRREEPPEIKELEGMSIPWGIEAAVKRIGGTIPDIIYHRGDWGKEPMITVFGRDAVEVVEKVETLIKKAIELGYGK
ncbi:MAG: bifunctional hydroxymethylpyrimidine kinase/phosphomethylpyrimidine kinase [Nitrososphaeria archaeon]|nr:bifunctional hydroxymethylpyrimidine kinase/phosphomethylpyrimidine kinase [Nitrososphaeria archaeon]